MQQALRQVAGSIPCTAAGWGHSTAWHASPFPVLPSEVVYASQSTTPVGPCPALTLEEVCICLLVAQPLLDALKELQLACHLGVICSRAEWSGHQG